MFDEMPHEQGNVFRTLVQGRHVNGKDIETIEQVGPKSLLLDERREITVRSRDQSSVRAERAAASQSLELPLLQTAEALLLEIEGNLADLVQEDRPAVGELEAADALRDGAGKGALLVAEQLALEQSRRDRGAVQLHERLRASRAQVVDRARDQLLPGPCLAVDQHRRIRGRHGLGIPQHTAQHRALADDFFEVPLGSHLVPQIDSFLGELVLQAANLAIGQGVVHGDRDLIGDLQQEADLVVRVGAVIASTQAERAEDAVTAEQRKDTADGEPGIELRIELEPALDRVRGPGYPAVPGTNHMRADGALAVHPLVPLRSGAAPRAV